MATRDYGDVGAGIDEELLVGLPVSDAGHYALASPRGYSDGVGDEVGDGVGGEMGDGVGAGVGDDVGIGDGNWAGVGGDHGAGVGDGVGIGDGNGAGVGGDYAARHYALASPRGDSDGVGDEMVSGLAWHFESPAITALALRKFCDNGVSAGVSPIWFLASGSGTVDADGAESGHYALASPRGYSDGVGDEVGDGVGGEMGDGVGAGVGDDVGIGDGNWAGVGGDHGAGVGDGVGIGDGNGAGVGGDYAARHYALASPRGDSDGVGDEMVSGLAWHFESPAITALALRKFCDNGVSAVSELNYTILRSRRGHQF
ncbi:uncharacterized protein LOC131293390 [Anopheles ziemanni]|uniref:uncharacterized protein LOC131264210 n=1 Tax=Anopheles coustani TaxID=139045 RepID=UPI00265971BF|nr:uncharacterized protein LOC131264210 [Anopheles coustani]XP_058177452.1 uncharacterized protein LOC131293390 [Anopheles ziemanni]